MHHTLTQIAMWLDTLDECMCSQNDACNDSMLGPTALDLDYEWFCKLPPDIKINIYREQYLKLTKKEYMRLYHVKKSQKEGLMCLSPFQHQRPLHKGLITMRKSKEAKQKRKRLLASQIRKKREEKEAKRKAKMKEKENA